MMLDVKKHEKEIELLLPRTMNDLKHILKGIDIELDDLLYGTSVVENIETGVPYLDKLIEEYKEVNLNELNYLSYVISHFDDEQKEKFSAVLHFEDDNKNIKSLKDVIQVAFSLDEYRYQDGVKDLDDYVKAITLGHEEEYSKLKITDIDRILKTMNDLAKGKYFEYDDQNYFVGYNTLDKITRRQRIKTYRLRDWEGNQYEFMTDIISAIGVTVVTNGTLYRNSELLISTNLPYEDYMEQLEKLTERKSMGIFSEMSKNFGIFPVYLGDERLRDFSILLEKNNVNENQEESEDEFDGGE